MLSHKYAPRTLGECIMSEELRQKLNDIIRRPRMQNMLFIGQIGMGKTCITHSASNDIFGENVEHHVFYGDMLLERNAKSILERIDVFCRMTTPGDNNRKLIIIDDCDFVHEKTQNSLCFLSEKYAHVNLIFTCTDIKKVSDALQSKCILISICPPTNDALIMHLQLICNNENIKYTFSALEVICRMSRNNIRDAMNMLHSIAIASDIINAEQIKKMYRQPNIDELNAILSMCVTGKTHDAISTALELNAFGYSYSDILSGLFDVVVTININHKTKLKILNTLCKAIYKMESTCESILQFEKCIIDLSADKSF